MISAFTHNYKTDRFIRETVLGLIELDQGISRFEEKKEIHALTRGDFLELIREAYDHLSECRETLRFAEKLVEKMRDDHCPPEIENLVSLCQNLQVKQIQLTEYIDQSTNRLLNSFS